MTTPRRPRAARIDPDSPEGTLRAVIRDDPSEVVVLARDEGGGWDISWSRMFGLDSMPSALVALQGFVLRNGDLEAEDDEGDEE